MKTLYSVLAVVMFLLGSLAALTPQTAFACIVGESGPACFTPTVVFNPSPSTAQAGIPITFTASDANLATPITYSVFDSDHTSISSSINGSEINSSTGVFTWTPEQGDIGDHTLLVNAAGPDGSTELGTLRLTVIAAPSSSAPSISSVSFAGKTADSNLTIDLNGIIDADLTQGGSITVNQDATLSAFDGSISLTKDASRTFDLTALNGYLSAAGFGAVASAADVKALISSHGGEIQIPITLTDSADSNFGDYTITIKYSDAPAPTPTTPVFNGSVTGNVAADATGHVSGSTTGSLNTTITGSLTAYIPGQHATFSGTISGDITGTFTGAVNYNGHDTLSAEITGSDASGHVYLIGDFQGANDGDFVARFITRDTPIDFVDSITVSGPTSVPAGEKAQMSAVLNGGEAGASVAWSVWTNVSDPNHGSATINQTTGELTATSPGSITVIASALDGSLVTQNYPVAITADATAPTVQSASLGGMPGLSAIGQDGTATVTFNLDGATTLSTTGSITVSEAATLAVAGRDIPLSTGTNDFSLTDFMDPTDLTLENLRLTAAQWGSISIPATLTDANGNSMAINFNVIPDVSKPVLTTASLGGHAAQISVNEIILDLNDATSLSPSASVTASEASTLTVDLSAYGLGAQSYQLGATALTIPNLPTSLEDLQAAAQQTNGTLPVISAALKDASGNETDYAIRVIIDSEAPTLNIAGFTANGSAMSGSNVAGYTLRTDGHADTHYALQFASGSVASENLKDETVGLTLTPTGADQTAALVSYYSSKPAEWQTYLDAAAAGSQPFAYIKTGGTAIQILDGAQEYLAHTQTDMIVPGDYPAGTYTVSGTIHDLAGNSTTVTFVLTVVAPSNMTAYNNALAAVHQADYTTASWATYQGVVSAHNVTDQNTQTEVDAATAAITEAQGDLVLFLTHGTTLPSFTTTPSGDGQTQSGTITTAAEATANSNGFATTLNISAGTVVTGPSTWDGVVSMPIATVATVTLPGYNTQVTSAIAIGSSDVSLTLSHAARLVFAGQSGKEVGWIDHSGNFTRITEVCNADNQADVDAQLGQNGDCFVVSTPNSDLVVWTKHFTTFVTLGITPQLSGVSIASSNANPQYAKVGDVVTVTFASAADLVAPTVDIAGHTGITAVASTTPGVWTASYTLQTGDSEGSIVFDVHFEDADHSGGEVTTTTDGSSVTYDKTAPVITLNAGTDTVTYGGSYTDAGAVVTDNVDTTRTISGTGTANTLVIGDYTLTYNATDAAGNPAVQQTRTVHIVQRPITIAANAMTKVYGNSDPELTYQITSGSLVTGDSFNGSLSRDAGENVGGYAISQGSVTAGSNYTTTYIQNNLTVMPAISVTTISCPTSQVYTGSVLTPCTVSVTGAGGLSLTPSPVYANNINTGTASVSYTFTGDTNHSSSSDAKTFEITKANAVILVSGYTGTYDGAAHGATGTATGVESTPANLNTLLHLGSTFVNVPGGTVHWTFDGNSNYNSNTGADVSISFAKANQSITFAPLADKNYGDADFTIGATAGSGFAVTFTASDSCTITGTTVHLTTKGDCTIIARQNGDSNWNAATDVANTFAIHDVIAPVITRTGDETVEAVFGHTYTDAGATATDDVDSSVTVTTSGAVDTSVLGTYTLTYNASDTAHNAATAITRTVRVVPQNSNSGSTGSGGGSSHASAPTAPASTGSVGGGEVLGAATFNFSSDLTLGATGEAVNALQQILIDAGYLKIASPMGTFGPQTLAAVKQYQQAHGISATGYVGPQTRTLLNTGTITTADQEAHTMLIIKIKAALADALAKLMELQKQLQAQS